jgi:hypothetical protein
MATGATLMLLAPVWPPSSLGASSHGHGATGLVPAAVGLGAPGERQSFFIPESSQWGPIPEVVCGEGAVARQWQ